MTEEEIIHARGFALERAIGFHSGTDADSGDVIATAQAFYVFLTSEEPEKE